jgi:glutathione S-transferase
MSMSNDVTVYSAVACPFSHRTRMALAAKGFGFETIEVDLLRPPDWFTAGPARIQMPKLVCGAVIIHGASIANEYIDERWADPPLLPRSPAARAEARWWIDWLEEKLQPTYEAALLEITPEKHQKLRQPLEAALRELEHRLQARVESGCWSPGAYWDGEQLGMVDLTYAATVMRFAGLRKFHGWEMPAGLPAVSAWIETLGRDPVVRETFHQEEVLKRVGTYLDTFRALARG